MIFYYFLVPISAFLALIYNMYESTIHTIFIMIIIAILSIALILIIILKFSEIKASKTYLKCSICNKMNNLKYLENIQGVYICHNCLKEADYSFPYNQTQINPEIVKIKLKMKELKIISENNNVQLNQNIKNKKNLLS